MESAAILGFSITIIALSIPIVAIILSHKRKTQINKIKEMELEKEILELKIKEQDGNLKLLEEENKKLDKIIYENNK
jgi:hypothetical protein